MWIIWFAPHDDPETQEGCPPHLFFFYMHEGVDIQKLCKLLKNTQQVTDDAGI